MKLNVIAVTEGSLSFDNGSNHEKNPYDYNKEYQLWESWSHGWHQRKQEFLDKVGKEQSRILKKFR